MAYVFSFLLIALAGISSSYADGTFLAEGRYQSEGLKVDVTKVKDVSGGNVLELRVVGESEANKGSLMLYIDTSRINTKLMSKDLRGESAVTTVGEPSIKLTLVQSFDGDHRIIDISGGGLFQNKSLKLKIVSDVYSGEIKSLVGVYKIAKWIFPIGLHSGPIKEINGKFNCDSLVKITGK
jgi:hypothetical protein